MLISAFANIIIIPLWYSVAIWKQLISLLFRGEKYNILGLGIKRAGLKVANDVLFLNDIWMSP